MKKYIGLFAILLMTFFVTGKVLLAESSNERDSITDDVKVEATDDGDEDTDVSEVKTTREILKKEIETKREAFKQEIELKRETMKQKMEELKTKIKDEKDTIKAKAEEVRIVGREKALERFDNTIKRISEWQVKVEAKITELEAKDVSVTVAKDFLKISEEKLDVAEKKVIEINAVLASSIDELTQENKTKLRTLTQETQTLVVEAHKALRDAIKSLKDEVKAKIQAETEVDTETEDVNDNDSE